MKRGEEKRRVKMPQLRTKYEDITKNMSKKNTRNENENQNEDEIKIEYLNTKLLHKRYDDENEDFTVEHEPNVSETFNYEKRVLENGCACIGTGTGTRDNVETTIEAPNIITSRPELDRVVINGPLTSDELNGARDYISSSSPSPHTYENLTSNLTGTIHNDLNVSKELLLHKFFRSTRRSAEDTLYENLCRGCGYGVFEAYGDLCYFCASIVNGVRDTPVSVGSPFSLSAENLDSYLINHSANVYENICENCYAIYSSDECAICENDLKGKSHEIKRELSKKKDKNIDVINSNPKKLIKSKSFNKHTEKRSLFKGLLGSLKRSPKVPKEKSKSGNSNSAARLEIIHNVDGYENVFRTQETFDLQRICELKCTQTSSSEQHIYGRVKKCIVESRNFPNNSASTQTLPSQLTEQQHHQHHHQKANTISGYLNSSNVTVSQPTLLTATAADDDDSVEDHQTEKINCITKETKSKTSNARTTSAITTATTNIATPNAKSGKRPRISKPRLLRAITNEKNNNNNNIEERSAKKKQKAAAGKQHRNQQPQQQQQKQALYLPDSVCNWMTSLRREVHNYYSCFGDDETIGLCNPKSIPAKNSLLTYHNHLNSNVRLGNGVVGVHYGCSNDFTQQLNSTGAIHEKPLSNELTNFTNIKATESTDFLQQQQREQQQQNSINGHSTKLSNDDDVSTTINRKNSNSSHSSETVTLRYHNNIEFQDKPDREAGQQKSAITTATTTTNTLICNDSPVEYTQMVNEFKRNLIVKQYKKRQMSRVDGNELINSVGVGAGSGAGIVVDSPKSREHDIEVEFKVENELSMDSMKIPEKRESFRQELRARRQAIYLKVDDDHRDHDDDGENENNLKNNDENSNKISNVNCLNNEKITCNNNNEKDNNSSSNNNSENDSMKTATTIRAELESTTFGESPVSRRKAVETSDSSSLHGRAKLNGCSNNNNNTKRCGIYEPNVDSAFVSDILNEFDRFLENEVCTTVDENRESDDEESILKDPIEELNSPLIINSVSSSLSSLSECQLRPYAAQQDQQHHDDEQPYIDKNGHHDDDAHEKGQLEDRSKYSTPIEQIFNFVKFNENVHLSRSLNKIIIHYQQPLRTFLYAIRERYPRVYAHYPQSRLIRKYWRFHAYCEGKLSVKLRSKTLKSNEILASHHHHSPAIHQQNGNEVVDSPYRMAASKASNGERNSVKIIVQQLEINCAEAASESHWKPTSKSTPSPPPPISQAKVLTNKLENSSASSQVVVSETINDIPIAESIKETVSSASSASVVVGGGVGGVNINHQIPLKPHRIAPKKPEPPQVPLRDPKTALSVRHTETTKTIVPPIPPLPQKRESLPSKNPMTIPTTHTHTHSNSLQKNAQRNHPHDHQAAVAASAPSSTSDESIYQPIWKFQTVGEAQERYQTDADYYDNTITPCKANDCDSLNAILISNDVEDHSEWETDDEFMFQTELMSSGKSSSLDAQSSEVNSLHSITSSTTTMNSSLCGSGNGSSIGNGMGSCSGSTIAGFSSSTATLASTISSSLTHHLLRNIGIFYSLTEPKLRAIIYDYDRVHASAYFAKRNVQKSSQQQQQEQQQLPSAVSTSYIHHHDSIHSNANDSGIGRSLKEEERERLPMPPPRTTSAGKSPTPNRPAKKFSESSGRMAGVPLRSEPLLSDSVQAWKFMLLDVNYLEDEEDMIVSEVEILHSQEIKDDIDTRQTQQLNILQRFKSASFGNLVDLPNEDDKKSIAERMRNKLQRGVFKLNVRSPKSDKKNRGIFRRAEATSLYLEDGMKPKYPIFNAPLDQLELDRYTYPNVPKFVVDCVAYIEQKDCIQQEGLYRASGNKVSIEELKQKLSESYIYDPKLLIIDDIHTLTSLLKLFFRELGAPLIPQETYELLGTNLTDAAGIEQLRKAFDKMREPNRSTLKFLIRHLTNVAACSSENRMPASNLAIVWGPCIMSANQIEFDIGRMNTLAKVLIENYAKIFNESERLVA